MSLVLIFVIAAAVLFLNYPTRQPVPAKIKRINPDEPAL
jgi:hypothetical protein